LLIKRPESTTCWLDRTIAGLTAPVAGCAAPTARVASLTGLTRIEDPWREFVSIFRNASTVRVKYAMLVQSIMPRLADVR
jgi:hypothetical protein